MKRILMIGLCLGVLCLGWLGSAIAGEAPSMESVASEERLLGSRPVAAATMRLPLDRFVVSSGFGPRRDPFEQLQPLLAHGPVHGVNPVRGVNIATKRGIAAGLAPAPVVARTVAGASTVWYMHEGVDLVAPAGTPVHAADDGVIAGAGPNGRYGNWIRIDHAGSLATVYGHLKAFAPGIEAGRLVARGELIGYVGSTGRSTGDHLHFELHSNGKPVDPFGHAKFKPDGDKVHR